ncbi:MAG: HNH endonuclease [Polyangiaceae bacterium]|nr:HNH endonuclease [Polyangiaceae bacterium]
MKGGHAQPSQSPSGLSAPVLLLNRYYAPVSIASARRGLVLLYCGGAHAVDSDGHAYDFEHWLKLPIRAEDDVVPLVSGQLRMPRVLHLLGYDRFPRVKIRLTRRNLLLRDDHQCQYCLRRPGVRELNLDHVVPRSRGGRETWENLVVSCRSCNLKKGRRTPEEAGMGLARPPAEPHWSTAAHILMATRAPYEEWQPFLRAS